MKTTFEEPERPSAWQRKITIGDYTQDNGNILIDGKPYPLPFTPDPPTTRYALVQQLRREKRENPMWFLSFLMLGTLYLSLCSFLLGWGSIALWDALT